ncbi:MAG TPA: HAD-IA family hydrolase [Actinomycetota bacterium]|jgi:putative hydrolase of the HAD superfamily|nr:HAD-IA family hydrolase [Actinomycetota bacterium]
MSRVPPIPDPLECVLFDAVDTLLAPAPSFQGRFVAVAAEHGVPLEEAAVDAAVAAAAREAAWPEDWTDPATQRAFWTGFYGDVLAGLGRHGDGPELAEALFLAFSDPAGYRLFDDVRPALDELAGRGITLGLVSNFEPWLDEVLALQGIADRFAAVAISGTLGVAKPDPRIFKAALDGAGADPGATVHVGDQPVNDVGGALAAGITPVLIDRFGRHPDAGGAHRVEDLRGLLELVG